MTFTSMDSPTVRSSPSLLNIRLNQQVTFAFLVTLIVPSVTFSCFILYHIVRKKQIRTRLTNHLVICIFLIYFLQTLTELPLTIVFLYRGEVAISSDHFCRFWFIIAGCLNAVSIQMSALLSVERYLLIFHNLFVQKHKFISHYIPLLSVLAVPSLYVIIFTNFYPCENRFVYNAWSCGSACYLIQPKFGIFTWVYAILAPVTIMVVFNMLVIVRVIHQKQRMLQKNLWSRNKKMIVQLLSITGTFYISWVPISLVSIVNMLNFHPVLNEIQATWALIGLIYIGVLFAPLASYAAIPELKIEINAWVHGCRRRCKPDRIETTLQLN